PLEARKKGVTIASAKAKAALPPSAKPARPAPAPKPVQTVVAQAKAMPSAATPISTSGGWRIQLGAFSQRGSAEALYRKLSGALSGHQAIYVPAGSITRLQVGPYPTRAAAQAACSALKGQACFPVLGK